MSNCRGQRVNFPNIFGRKILPGTKGIFQSKPDVHFVL